MRPTASNTGDVLIRSLQASLTMVLDEFLSGRCRSVRRRFGLCARIPLLSTVQFCAFGESKAPATVLMSRYFEARVMSSKAAMALFFLFQLMSYPY